MWNQTQTEEYLEIFCYEIQGGGGRDTFYTGEMIVSKRIELAHDALLSNNTYIVIMFTRFIGALRDWINVMPANYKVEVVVREEDISI